MKQIQGALPCLARKLLPPEYPVLTLLWNALKSTCGYRGRHKLPHQRVLAFIHFRARCVLSIGSSLALSSTQSL